MGLTISWSGRNKASAATTDANAPATTESAKAARRFPKMQRRLKDRSIDEKHFANPRDKALALEIDGMSPQVAWDAAKGAPLKDGALQRSENPQLYEISRRKELYGRGGIAGWLSSALGMKAQSPIKLAKEGWTKLVEGQTPPPPPPPPPTPSAAPIINSGNIPVGGQAVRPPIGNVPPTTPPPSAPGFFGTALGTVSNLAPLAALWQFGVSAVRNTISVFKRELTVKEAIIHTVKETAVAAVATVPGVIVTAAAGLAITALWPTIGVAGGFIAGLVGIVAMAATAGLMNRGISRWIHGPRNKRLEGMAELGNTEKGENPRSLYLTLNGQRVELVGTTRRSKRQLEKAAKAMGVARTSGLAAAPFAANVKGEVIGRVFNQDTQDYEQDHFYKNARIDVRRFEKA